MSEHANGDLARIEQVLDEKVRPALRAHGGAIEVDHLENKVLHVKLLGQCAGCPSADLTNETLVEAELTAALPETVERVVVVQNISDELWDQAKRLLRDHHL
ncbi:MAG: NifU family protein [Oscillibacter sp.]